MENPFLPQAPSATESLTMSNTPCGTHCQRAMVFWGTNIHPGQLYLLVQVLMDSYKQLTQLGVNCSVKLEFHASSTSCITQKQSLKVGGCLAVIAIAFRIASKCFLDMKLRSLMGAPTKQSTSPKVTRNRDDLDH